MAGSRAEGKGIGTVDGIMVGFATGLGMAPPATGGSEVSPCGEASSKQPQIGFSLLSLSVLGTATLPTGTSEALPRGEGGFYQHFGTGTLPTDASEASLRGKRSDDRSMTGN